MGVVVVAVGRALVFPEAGIGTLFSSLYRNVFEQMSSVKSTFFPPYLMTAFFLFVMFLLEFLWQLFVMVFTW